MKKIGRAILTIILLFAVAVCGFELREISAQYSSESKIKEELSKYRPKQTNKMQTNSDETNQAAASEKIVNQSVIDIRYEINGDIIGWLTVPNTRIDYPVVIAADNDFYLRRNIYKEPMISGSIFMDYRCDKNFSCFNTVIYGHNMKNGSMFGDLKLFADPDFFESNTSGTLFTENNIYTLEIFAYMVVKSDDMLIYNPSSDREEFFEYIKRYARRYREHAAAESVVTLSTCAYEYEGARMVLLAVIK